MSVLNFGNNQPLRSKVYPQAKVKLNARRDDLEYRIRAENTMSECLFKSEALKNDLSTAGTIEIEGEPAYLMLNNAKLGAGGRFNGLGSRDFTNNSPSVPVLTALNRLKGLSTEVLEEQIQWVGHIEMANQDNRERRVNLQCGGSMSTLNNGPHPISMNAYIRYRVPTPEELENLASPYASENLGAGGRVVLVSEEFNIETIDIFDPVKVHKTLQWIITLPDKNDLKVSKLRIQLFKDLIRAFLVTKHVTSANFASDRDIAAGNGTLPQFYEDQKRHLNPSDKAIVDMAQQWIDIYDDHLNHGAPNSAVRALESIFRSFLRFKHQETRNVGCKASFGAMPNTTMDIQYGPYVA